MLQLQLEKSGWKRLKELANMMKLEVIRLWRSSASFRNSMGNWRAASPLKPHKGTNTHSQKERKRRGGSNGGRCEMLDSIRSTRGQREIITLSFCSFFSKAFFMSCYYYIKRSNCFITGLLHNGLWYSYDLFDLFQQSVWMGANSASDSSGHSCALSCLTFLSEELFSSPSESSLV